MVSCSDLSGVMAMMPAFATDDAASIDAKDTVDVNRLEAGLNQMISDGAGVVSTCGSFGEFHTLLWDEFKTLNRAVVEIADKRVPIFVGCTALNSREALQRMEYANEIGAYGVLIGVPFYFPSTVDNALRFYKDIAERFPKLGIMIYHNPALHNVTLPVPCFEELIKIPSVVAMKDSHRDTMQFMKWVRRVFGPLMPGRARNPYWHCTRPWSVATRTWPKKSCGTFHRWRQTARRTCPGVKPHRKSPLLMLAIVIRGHCVRLSWKFRQKWTRP